MQCLVRRLTICLALVSVPSIYCQTASSSHQDPSATEMTDRSIAVPACFSAAEELPKRIFGIIPNYRSHPSLQESNPLTSGQKFKLAVRDSFDPGTFLLAGASAGIGLASKSSPSYGYGATGYGQYYGSTYGDLMIGNVMTEAVYPSLFHQDPRYFRKGSGSMWSRLGYAMSQIIITHGDNHTIRLNFSEIAGNATATAISNAYNPDNRTASDAAAKLGVQLGLDMAGNILKEFGPDLHRRLFGRKHAQACSGRPTVR